LRRFAPILDPSQPLSAAGKPKEISMLVLRGGRLIDGTGAGPVAGVAIVVRNGRIAAVVREPAGEWPYGGEIINVADMTVLPGLIDCHDHLAMHGYDLARRWGLDEPQSTRTLRTAKVLQETLATAYTAVRDAAGARCRVQAGDRRGIDRRAAAHSLARHHLADRRHRRPGEPVRVFLLRPE
jgi:imidazolonepropionase-like amidohydrolase